MITKLRLKGFRQYRDQTVEFRSGLNLITGPNNAGKSTLFYALEYALFGNVGGYRSPAALMHPEERTLGAELVFQGRDQRTYRLQRIHEKPPRSRTKVVGHFTLKVRDNEDDADAELYVLSSDFRDHEEALALKLFELLGVTKRVFETAVHTRQGECATILQGSTRLDMVLGVTAAVAASEELRAMALDSEKSAASKPVLEQSLKNLADQRTAEERRLKNWKKELDSNRKEDRKLHKLMDEGAAQQRGVSEKLALFDEYEDATQRVQAAKDAAGQAEERLSQLNGELAEIDQIGNEAALKDALRANRQQQRDMLSTLRETDRETGRAEASGESAKAADLEERGDGLASELEALQDQERASDRALWECQHAKTRRTELEAAIKAAKQELEDVASGVKKAEGALKKAATNIEEGASRKKLEASLQKSQLESAKAEAKLEVLEESVEQLEDDCADAAETLKELDREKADFEEKLSKASDSEDHAKLFRKSAAAFKWLQTRLRESAAQHLSERILVFHKQLSGNSDEITGVSIDSANYQVHVKARGHKSEAPAHLFQGGGHRVLLGLAFKLALAEWMGNVPCLLLDEPTDGLDSNHLGTMLDALGDCPATQQVIMITHEPTLTTKEGNIGVERIEGYSTITQEAPV